VLVPETAVNEDDFFIRGKHYIGPTRQISRVQPIPVTQLKCQMAHHHFLGQKDWWRKGVGLASLHSVAFGFVSSIDR
jgi:hypothetical protein